MPDIVVDTYNLKQYAQRLGSVNSRLTKLDSRLNSLYLQVGLIESYNLIQADAMIGVSLRLSCCQNYLNQTSADFSRIENELNNIDPMHFSNSFFEGIQSFFDGIVHSFSTGVAIVVKSISNVTSAIIQDYENKGITWKILKTGCAVVKSAGAIMVSFTAWGLTAGSGGLCAPLAALVTLHSSNTIANSFFDLYNIWLGDKEEVGKINCLKTIDEALFGDAVGDVIYNFASVASSIASITAIAGKVKQAPDLWKSIKGIKGELKTGISGIWNIATTTNLSDIGCQLKLLSYQVPNIANVISCMSILGSVKSTSESIFGAIGDTIVDVWFPDIQRKSLLDYIIGENTLIDKIAPDIQTIKEKYEKAANTFDDYQRLKRWLSST